MNKIELKRDIYEKLVEWKKEDGMDKVLELEGPRQVGKTYILKKFAQTYHKSTYINLVESSGKEFLKCWSMASDWVPGQKRIERPMLRALELFDSEFKDTEEHLVIIDEIQESAEIYSMIREFAREFDTHFIVTGSYLGKTREKEFFHAAGDIVSLQMETLTFGEFLGALGRRELYENCSLYGESTHDVYDQLREDFEIYMKIGGYPEVIITYLRTKDIPKCLDKIESLINIFIKESTKYFESELEIDIFDKIFSSIALTMLKEKKGSNDLVSDFSKIVFAEESRRITKRTTNAAISWLYLSHQIGYCSKSINCNHLEINDNVRFYFTDLGVANLFLTKTGEIPETVEGILCENFVYLELVRRIQRKEIAGLVPWFAVATDTGGELDFYCRSLSNFTNYGIEVKRGTEATKTANYLLEKKLIDKLYVLKNTYGGISGDKYTVPIYLVEKISFK